MNRAVNRILRILWDHITLGPLALPVMRAIEKTGGFNC